MEGFKCCSSLCLPKDSLPPPPARFNAVPASASEGAAKGTKTLFNLALAMQAEGKLGDACSLYEQVVAQDRNFHDAWYNLGHIKEEQGNSSSAVRCLREALRVRPDDKESHLLMAYALESLADLNEAVEHYTAAKKLDPKCTTTLYNVANAYHDLGQLDEAAKNYRAVLELEAGNVDAHFNLGVVLQDAGDLSGALTAYRAALAIDDGLEDAAAAAAGLEAALAQQAATSSGVNHSSYSKSHDASATRSGTVSYNNNTSLFVNGDSSRTSGYSSFNIRSGSSGSTPPGLPPLPTSVLLSPAQYGAQSSGPVEAADGNPDNPYGSLHAAAVIRALRKKKSSSVLPGGTTGDDDWENDDDTDNWDHEDSGVAATPASAAGHTLAASTLKTPSRATSEEHARSSPINLAANPVKDLAVFNALVAETSADCSNLAGTSAGGVKYSADELLFYRDHIGGLKATTPAVEPMHSPGCKCTRCSSYRQPTKSSDASGSATGSGSRVSGAPGSTETSATPLPLWMRGSRPGLANVKDAADAAHIDEDDSCSDEEDAAYYTEMRWLRKESTQVDSPRQISGSSAYNDYRHDEDYGRLHPSDEEDERGDALMPLGGTRTEHRGRMGALAVLNGSRKNGAAQELDPQRAPPPPRSAASRGAPSQELQPQQRSVVFSLLPTSPQRAAAAPNIWAPQAPSRNTMRADSRHNNASATDDDDWSDDGDEAPVGAPYGGGNRVIAPSGVHSSSGMHGGLNSSGGGDDSFGIVSEDDDDEEAAAMEAALAAVMAAPYDGKHDSFQENMEQRQHSPLLSLGDGGCGAGHQGMLAPGATRSRPEGQVAAPRALVAPSGRPPRNQNAGASLPGADAPAMGASAAAAARARVAARTGVMPRGGPEGGTQYQLLGVKPGQRLRVRPQPRRTRA